MQPGCLSFIQRRAHAATAVVLFMIAACDAPGVEPSSETHGAAIDIHYVEYGSGEPVVLVHGFSQTHESWLQTPLFQDLQRDHRVIAADLRGHGESSKPHDPKAYGRNLEADLVALLDSLDIDRAHFVGFSMGASVVGGLLTSAPERVQTAAMGSGLFTTWDPHEEEFAVFTEAREQSGERYPWEPANQDFKALAAVIRGAQFATLSDAQIAAIDTPTIVAFGSVELEHMSEAQKTRLANLPGSFETLVVAGADHDSANAAILSQEFSRAVRELIASHPARQQL